MKVVKARPAKPELKIRVPETMLHLPPEGAMVELSSYWIRLAEAGDVVFEEVQ